MVTAMAPANAALMTMRLVVLIVPFIVVYWPNELLCLAWLLMAKLLAGFVVARTQYRGYHLRYNWLLVFSVLTLKPTKTPSANLGYLPPQADPASTGPC